MSNESILDRIVAHKRVELAERSQIVHIEALRARARNAAKPRDFRAAITRGISDVRLIAEVKKASPSKGVIRADFHPVEIATEYARSGADALSVLTDERFFQGHLDYLTEIQSRVDIPLLRKDFTLDEYHVVEARAAGADAVLLIVAVLELALLKELHACAAELGMAAIVEVHDADEVERALSAGAEIIGVNNRNLRTFETRLETTFALRELVPSDTVVVSESGINSRRDVERLAEAGVDAMLVGESLMRAESIFSKIAELRGTGRA